MKKTLASKKKNYLRLNRMNRVLMKFKKIYRELAKRDKKMKWFLKILLKVYKIISSL